MLKEIVKVYIDSDIKIGDFVKCVDCEYLQLIQRGGTACGECESENLMWADDQQEVTEEDLEKQGYILD